MSEMEYQLKIERQFESFCKTVIRNLSIDLKRKNAERFKCEYHLDDLPIYEQEKIEFSSMPKNGESEIYFVDGMVFTKNELYRAIEMLPDNSINIIQLHYFGNLTDSEIGELLKLSRRTTTYRRNRALDLIRQYLEGLKNDRE